MSSYCGNKKDLITRLKRVEGQIRGIQNMIDDEKYCVEVLTQIAAVKGALNKVGMSILESHTHGCVKDAVDVGEEGDEVISELMDVIFKFTK
ncbi:DNA-binding FrmR family transcriptional regulator [Orenia metallireducens]|uniref:DNA-binding transcriptional regulator, FrmR family n=1 Tax=Orenia metallireducens TaxID=1413210 RepID=A0A285IDY1_9FIRM|nr:metal-sensitive transcriptional regulator [Orenia metallireducens]PRX19241.1 DNA-binding FrmR family transcriptional regulator [Orenia metallireducens]SNY46179.1 DNA-binding transcriptional regulator, FrmR family [Orenia metallireducens]